MEKEFESIKIPKLSNLKPDLFTKLLAWGVLRPNRGLLCFPCDSHDMNNELLEINESFESLA